MKDWKLERIAWIDVETTGLDPEVDLLLEVALIVTDGDLHEIARESMIVHHTEEDLRAAIFRAGRDPEVNEYIWDMHSSNGLILACQDGLVEHPDGGRTQGYALPVAEVDDEMAYVLGCACQGTEGSRYPIGGCSVWLDRSMLRVNLPQLYAMIHRRSVDASSYEVALVNWTSMEHVKRAAPRERHRAMMDCEDSIKLARRLKQRLERGEKAISELEELKRLRVGGECEVVQSPS